MQRGWTWVLAPCALLLGGCGARTGLSDSNAEGGLPPVRPSHASNVSPRCTDTGPTLVYVVTTSSTLLRFAPPSGTFTTIGSLECPSAGAPFSMAVDHTGTAYVAYDTGDISLVDVTTAACRPSHFTPGQQGFSRFGMGFVANGADASSEETLYLASAETPSRLARVDTATMALHVVGTFSPPLTSPELTGTGAGELFAFSAVETGGSAIEGVDENTAEVRAQSLLPSITQGNAWAFAFWGGDFYTFTAPGSGSIVMRFRPSDGSLAQVGGDAERVVGAGVSTCAPTE